MKKYLIVLAMIPVFCACETMDMVSGAGEVVYEVFCEDSNDVRMEKLERRVKALENTMYNNRFEETNKK